MMNLELMLDTVRKGFADSATAEDKSNAARVLRAGLAMLEAGGASTAPASPAPSSSAPRGPQVVPKPDMLGMLIGGLMQRLPEWQQTQIREEVAADVPMMPFVVLSR